MGAWEFERYFILDPALLEYMWKFKCATIKFLCKASEGKVRAEIYSTALLGPYLVADCSLIHLVVFSFLSLKDSCHHA